VPSPADKKIVRGNPGRTRELILAASLDEFAANGYGGGRIDEIAKKAGVNKQALYYHFESKDGLYRATLEYGYALVRSFDPHPNGSTATPSEQLAELITGYFDNVREHQNVVALVAEENRLQGRHLHDSAVVSSVNAPFVERVASIYGDGVADGSFRAGWDPQQLWITVVSEAQFYFSNAYTISYILQADIKTEERVAERKAHIVAFILAALKA
jgi:TetR/AcrR family transcriptional regulator